MNVNLFVVIVLAVLVWKVVIGYKKGILRQIVSLISLVFLCLVAALIGNGIFSYLDGEFLTVAVMVFLLALLGIVHHILNLVLFPAKLISKLPVVHSVDKLLGAALGAVETLLLLWTVYCFAMMPETGETGELILQYTADNQVLAWLFEHNRMSVWMQAIGLRLGSEIHLPSVSITIEK